MELYTLNINVNKQRLSFGENKPEIFSGDQSIDFVEFTFEDDMWNFPDIWAIFSRFKGTSYQVALEDNKVMIPAEVMQKRGYVYIGLMATDGENVQTSSVLQYSIGQGATNVDAITPSASIYEQFLADLDAYQTAVADLDDIESRITTAEGNVSMIEQAVTDLNEQLGDIYVDISTINGQITTIQNNIGTAQGDIVSIQNGINTLNGQVAGLDTAVGTLSNRVTALQSSVTSLEGRLTTAGNTLTDFEGRLTTAGTTLTNLEGSISDAENDIQTVQGDIETIQSDIEDIQTAIEQNNVVTDVTAEGISLVDNHIADLSFMCVTDTASGDVASFPDGSGVAMKKAEVSLEPIQDLHGYDKPWPGGGGKNKFDKDSATLVLDKIRDDSGAEVGSVGACYTSSITKVAPSTQYTLNGLPSSPNFVFRIYFLDANGDWISRTSGIGFGSLPYTFTTPTNCYGLQLQFGKANTDFSATMLELGSTSSAWTPYSNICPIDGYEDVGVSVKGVNMWDEEWENGRINANTGANASGNGLRSENFIPILPSTTYYIVRGDYTGAGGVVLYYYDSDKGYLYWENKNGMGGTFTTPDNAHFLKFNVQTSVAVTTYNHDISINYPSTDHDYHVYAGTDYTTDLGRTVYGGTVDLVSGRLVVDRAVVVLDGSQNMQLNGMTANTSRFFYTASPTKANGADNFIADRFAYATTDTVGSAVGRSENGGIEFRLPTSVPQTVDDYKTWFTANPTTLVYELATPQTYQLTPQQIQTLVGANNVWSEDGAIEVEYIANLKDYIDKKINA